MILTGMMGTIGPPGSGPGTVSGSFSAAVPVSPITSAWSFCHQRRPRDTLAGYAVRLPGSAWITLAGPAAVVAAYLIPLLTLRSVRRHQAGG